MSSPALPNPLPPDEEARAKLRRGVYALLIAVSVGAMTGRVLAVNSVDLVRLEASLKGQGAKDWQKQRPFLGANDRSRWLTVRSLVEQGTYAIDDYVTDPIAHPNWDTIDMVQHKDASGALHLYSSKPPLLATLYAVPYWIIHKLTGATLETHPYEIGRAMLILVNVLPMAIYFVVVSWILERYGRTDWGRMFVMAAAAFGTFLTTFAVVVNNHLPAAVSAAVAMYAAMRIWYDGERRLRYFALAGVSATFAAACELPAVSLFVVIAAAVIWKSPRNTLVAFAPAALVVIGPFFLANWIAHQSLRPPYAHRSITDSADNWYDYEYVRTDGTKVESYWRNPKGVDQGEPSIGTYALNVLVGHHGIFSLTPIWLLAIPGIFALGWGSEYRLRAVTFAILTLSIVCVAFYIVRPIGERNYGGMTSGFRWVFWLAPLWLVAVLPAADKLSKWRWSRGLSYVLLGLSTLSATYPIWNPWTHPWLWNVWTYFGWAT